MNRASRIGLALSLLGAAVQWNGIASAQIEELPPVEDEIPDDGVRAREDTYESARGMGMGAGARASAVGTSAVAYNPANMPLAQLYHMESFATYMPQERAWTLGGTVADSVSNKIAAGMSFRGIYGGGNRNYRGYDGRLALGMPLSQRIAIGVSGRFLRLKSRQRNDDGERIGGNVKAFTMDVAIRVTATEGLHIAALGYNLIQTDTSIAPTLLGGSLSYSMGTTFSLAADVFVDMTTFEDPEMVFGFGGEYLAGGTVPIRIGFRREMGRDLNQLTAALGYVDQNLGIDIAIRQDIASDTKETAILAAFRYHVQ